MEGQQVLASSAFLLGILMGFVLALLCMVWVANMDSDGEEPGP